VKTIAVVGSSGKDMQIKIESTKTLPEAFRKYLKKSIPYSLIPEFYGNEWTVERALEYLQNQAIEPLSYNYGGRCGHIAYQIALLGGNIRLLTTFGGDDYKKEFPGFFGGPYYDHLKKTGVKMDILEVEIPKKMWGKWDKVREHLISQYSPEILNVDTLIVKEKETMTIVCNKDARGTDWFYIDDINGAPPVEKGRPIPIGALERSDIVFITSAEEEFMTGCAKEGAYIGKEIVIDVGSYGITPNYLKTVVPLTEIVFGNPSEIKQILDAYRIKAPEQIFDVTGTNKPRAIVIEDKITGTAQILQRNTDSISIGPIKLNKSGNSIGCCDGIAAGFLSLYQRGYDLAESIYAGMTIMASIWEVSGVQEGMLTKEQLLERLPKLFPEVPSDFMEKLEKDL
jgi:sugar/nucleoside kinase (ribokinase family)